MAYQVYVRIKDTTGNPEVWAYDDSGSDCDLRYGSFITGGISGAIKTNVYGNVNAPKKLREGYQLVSSSATLQDIMDARNAVRSNQSVPASSSKAANDITLQTMRLWGKPIPAGRQTPAAAFQASKPAAKPIQNIFVPTQVATANAWNW